MWTTSYSPVLIDQPQLTSVETGQLCLCLMGLHLIHRLPCSLA